MLFWVNLDSGPVSIFRNVSSTYVFPKPGNILPTPSDHRQQPFRPYHCCIRPALSTRGAFVSSHHPLLSVRGACFKVQYVRSQVSNHTVELLAMTTGWFERRIQEPTFMLYLLCYLFVCLLFWRRRARSTPIALCVVRGDFNMVSIASLLPRSNTPWIA